MGITGFSSGGIGGGRGLVAVLVLVLVSGNVSVSFGAVVAKTPVSVQADAATRLGIDDALNRIILPAQTPSFVGGQAPPLVEVTPGRRFMNVLVSHVALYQNPETGLGLGSDQKAKLRDILEKTRAELIKTDASDFRLVQLFEAALVQKSLPVAALRSLNVRIGEVEGREAGRFVSSLREIQAVLSEPQIATLKQKNVETMPSSDISVSSALSFADRMLAERWQITMHEGLSAKIRTDLAARYRKARNWLWTLAAEKTVSDRNVDDVLNAPFVDMAVLDSLEKKAGPLEGKFWETFLRIAVLLNLPPR